MMQATPGFNGLGLSPKYEGKVRELYDLGDRLLIICTDRLSAFDVVFDQLIPGKGIVLNEITKSWFELCSKEGIFNHFISDKVEDLPPEYLPYADILKNRFLIVRKGNRINFEFIVRAYLMGSAVKEYQTSGGLWGQSLPEGLDNGSRLVSPLLTATTKVDSGGHDEPVSLGVIKDQIGEHVLSEIQKLSFDLFNKASLLLDKQNILLMDTKFEFAFFDNRVMLIDEILTPDSSRFCLKDNYSEAVAKNKPIQTLDKQIIRDHLQKSDWNFKHPAPELPDEIIKYTYNQYQQIKEIIACNIK
jgi:phosphoribosylaminoimidazole-succinocarboxamide synthase